MLERLKAALREKDVYDVWAEHLPNNRYRLHNEEGPLMEEVLETDGISILTLEGTEDELIAKIASFPMEEE